MGYKNLNELIAQNKESADFFYALPSRTQMQLLRHSNLVTGASYLELYANYFSTLPISGQQKKRTF